MKAEVKRMGEEFKHIGFLPAPRLTAVWEAFWSLRATKAHEDPINYTDVYHYTRLLRLVLEVWEVKAILRFDRSYYSAYNKYND